MNLKTAEFAVVLSVMCYNTFHILVHRLLNFIYQHVILADFGNFYSFVGILHKCFVTKKLSLFENNVQMEQ